MLVLVLVLVLVLAAALLVPPWAATGRRPGLGGTAALAAAAVGAAVLRSGLTARPVEPKGGDLTLCLWLLVPRP